MMTEEVKFSEINKVISLRKEGRHEEALKALLKAAERADNFVLQARYAKILSTLDSSVLKNRPSIKVAVLSSFTDKFLCDILKFWLFVAGFNAEFFESEYGTMTQTILDSESKLYQFDPDIIWIFTTFMDIKIRSDFERPQEQVLHDIDEVIEGYSSLWGVLQNRCRAYIIQNNADLPPYRTFGNFDGILPNGYLNILRRYNSSLLESLREGVMVFDLEYISSLWGKERWFELTQWYNSKIPFNLDAVGEVAYQVAWLIAAIKGKARKCLVLDLDNTLWGGVIGDDGLHGIVLGDGPVGEAFVDFQQYILELKKRGIILAVCSKNDEANAKEPFLKHPDMRLKLEDISVFKANWANKADNIKEIASILNIGLDSIVFVDDNPAEREIVESFLPQIVVPAMPEDPSCFRQTLDSGRYFETLAISAEDSKRTEYYRINAVRDNAKKDFCDLISYLKGLEMVAIIGSFDEFHLPRVVQLINKSNQFHLTTTRYSENEVKAMACDPYTICQHFSLKDKFGDNGLIAVVILKKVNDDEYVIDTWCMSCRVLSRGMEEFICQNLIEICTKRGLKRMLGVYIPSAKNGLVADLYSRLGFLPTTVEENGNTHWQLDLLKASDKLVTHIRSSNQ